MDLPQGIVERSFDPSTPPPFRIGGSTGYFYADNVPRGYSDNFNNDNNNNDNRNNNPNNNQPAPPTPAPPTPTPDEPDPDPDVVEPAVARSWFDLWHILLNNWLF